MTKTFRVGDKVRWTSQASGSTLTKVGTVVVIVYAHSSAVAEAYNSGLRVADKFGWGSPRDHESYLVYVPGRGIYWPRVSGLQLVEKVAHVS